MVRSIQITMHLPMAMIVFPANAILMIEVFIPTVGFDVLQHFDFWEKQSVLNFDFDLHSNIKDFITNQIVDIDFDAFSSLMLL